ncbi:snakin-1 [Quercus suber]|uniref:Snakin-1 n=1 Tax=Quercus suber TaxID=58331 RepID=A0AAW0KWJ8_QUESU
MKLPLQLSCLFALVLSSSFFEATMAGSSFCDSKCQVRCSKAESTGPVLEVLRVSGAIWDLGNKDECPCYRDLKNSKGKTSALDHFLVGILSQGPLYS